VESDVEVYLSVFVTSTATQDPLSICAL